MSVSFSSPLALFLLLLLWPLAVRWRRARLSLSPQRRRLSLALRLLTLGCLVLAAAGTQMVSSTRELSVIFLLDRSLSTGGDSLQWQRDYIEKALSYKGELDSYGVLVFAQETRQELPVGAKESALLGPFGAVVERSSSALTSALRFAATSFPGATASRLVVLSDGQSTEPESAEEAASLAAAGIEVWTVPLPQNLQVQDLLLSRLDAPNSIAKNEPFLLRAVVESQGIGQAELLLSARGQPVERLQLKLREGANLFLIPQRIAQSGPVGYEARVLAPGDQRLENNKAETLVLVGQEQLVLVLRSEPGPSALVSWLERAGMKARAVTPDQLPRKVGAWRDVSALLIEDVSALDWSLELQKVVSLLVRDAGMGLMMLGSDSTFGLGGYSQTPIEALLPLELSIRRPKDMPLAALVECLDKSGSMTGRPIEMAREAAIAAGHTLSEKDMLGVVSFDEAARWVYPLSVKGEGGDYIKKIASLRAGGGTDMYPALEQAISALEGVSAALKHVIVLSDGATNPAAFEALMQRAERGRITVSAVALGAGADLEFLKTLTRQGKGRLYVAPDTGPGTPLPQIFVREAMLATGSGLSRKPSQVLATGAGQASPILQGLALDRAPHLETYNLSSPKSGTASTLLASPQGDPVLATGRAGLGKTAAWTSDLGGKWSAAWAQTEGPDGSSLLETVILRTVRTINAVGELSERSAGASLQVRTLGGGERASLEIEVRSREALRGPVTTVLVDGKGQRTSTPLHSMSAHLARGTIPMNQPGSALLFAHDADGKLLARSVVSMPLTPEFARLGNDLELLKALASRPGGRFEPAAEEIFSPPSKPFVKRMPIGDGLVRGALLLLLLEIAVRRLPRPRGRSKATPPASEPVDGPRHTMASLRQVKQSSRERSSGAPLPSRPRVERTSASPLPSPPKTSPSSPGPSSKPTPETSGESTLERLRQVKKRGREQS